MSDQAVEGFTLPPAIAPGAPSLLRSTVRDAPDRVMGHFRFAVDRRVEGELHGAVVRSTVPHGLLRSINTAAALSVTGVLAVVTGSDVETDPLITPYHGEARTDQPVIALDRVRYIGEPLAVVVASSPAVAAAAAKLVVADIEVLPAVFVPEDAAAPGAPVLHDRWPTNECGQWTLRRGDAHHAIEAAAFRHTGTYRSPAATHVAMEPHCATATWLEDGSLEVWSATQSPYALRERLAGIFGLAESDVRVRADNLGGGFGGKLYLVIEGLAALAARVVRRPVRLELQRDEEFLTTGKHAAVVTITTGLDAEGIMVGRLIDIQWNAGAYALTTPRGSRSGLIRSVGPYKIPNVLATSRAWYSNTVPTGPFRGAMTGQVCWAHEQATDEMAAMIGLDPVEFRRRNLLQDGDVFATGEVMHEMRYIDLLDAAWEGMCAASDADAPGGLRSSGRTDGTIPGTGGHRRARGRGVAVVLKSIITPSRSEATVSIAPDGEIVVRATAVEMGQGAAASVAELTACSLGVPVERVRVALVDTASTPYDKVTSSSRTTYTVGIAVQRACDDLCRRLRPLVPDLLADGADLGTVSEWAAIARAAGDRLPVGEGVFESPAGAGDLDDDTQGIATDHWHQGAVAVEVEVDTETGRVEVLAAHGASYAGRVVDPLRAKKQTQGGMIFGLGSALLEDLRYDEGQPVTNLSDYEIPSIVDAPVVLGSTVLESDDPHAHPAGIGENTVPPMAPAIGNAVTAATGVRIYDLPITSEKVLRALRMKEADAS